jgi:hypothetical protein
LLERCKHERALEPLLGDGDRSGANEPTIAFTRDSERRQGPTGTDMLTSASAESTRAPTRRLPPTPAQMTDAF